MRSITIVLALALLVAGCASKNETPPADTSPPGVAHDPVILDARPTPLSLWRNLTDTFVSGECHEVKVASKGLYKKAQSWLIVREGVVTVTVDQVDDDYHQRFGCVYENEIKHLTLEEIKPEDGLVTTPVFDVHLSDAVKYSIFCDTDKPCEFSFWAHMIGALDPLPPLQREEVGHTETGACTFLPIEGDPEHPGFNFNGFYEAGDGSMGLVPPGGEDAYCASGTGAIVETAVQEKVFAAIEPIPFEATDRAVLVFRCLSGASGCDHRMMVYLGALAEPRYDATLGPGPDALKPPKR